MLLHRITATALLGLAMLTAGASSSSAQSGPKLSGRLLIEWENSQRFVYRRDRERPLRFITAAGTIIEPADIYTDGGSIPGILQNIRGLSPWNLGPAYVVHDWLFQVHRCSGLGTAAERNVSFQESADILRDIAIELVKRNRVAPEDNQIGVITAAVRSWFALRLWDQTDSDCSRPPDRPIVFDLRPFSRLQLPLGADNLPAARVDGPFTGPLPTTPADSRVLVDITFD